MNTISRGPKHNTIESWAEWALEIRSEMFDSEATFFFTLLEGENGRCPWRGVFTSYGEFLRKFDLTHPSRYSAFKTALGILNEAKIREIGVDAAIKTAAVQDLAQRNAVLLDITQVTEQRGCQLTRSEVIRRIQRIAPTPKLTNVLKGVMRDSEVSALRRRVAELEAANEALCAGVKALGGDPEAIVARAAEQRAKAGKHSRSASTRMKKKNKVNDAHVTT